MNTDVACVFFFVFSGNFEDTGGCLRLEIVTWGRSVVSVNVEIHFCFSGCFFWFDYMGILYAILWWIWVPASDFICIFVAVCNHACDVGPVQKMGKMGDYLFESRVCLTFTYILINWVNIWIWECLAIY